MILECTVLFYYRRGGVPQRVLREPRTVIISTHVYHSRRFSVLFRIQKVFSSSHIQKWRPQSALIKIRIRLLTYKFYLNERELFVRTRNYIKFTYILTYTIDRDNPISFNFDRNSFLKINKLNKMVSLHHRNSE